MKDIRMLDCAKNGGGDLCVNWGFALQRKIDGDWVTIAWFRSRQDVKDMVEFYGKQKQSK